ncbi:MAG: Smr/MutS family protein [Bacilli bacterium]|jgi:DNA mismatch repair protein MutS2
MKAIESLLEFGEIKHRLLNHAHAVLATKAIEGLSFIPEAELPLELDRLAETMSLAERYGSFPIMNSQDLAPYFVKANKGAALAAEEIHAVAEDLRTIAKVVAFFKGKGSSYPLLQALLERFTNQAPLLEKIDKVLAPDLSIKDTASPVLNKIRHQKRSLETKMQQLIQKLTDTYMPYLSDKQAVVRNGHLVLPVLSQEKNKVEGILHAMSDTGYTSFIEPTPLVMLNNELYVLTSQEHEEIHRILLALTQDILTHELELLTNNVTLGSLDLYGAKAAYGLAIKGHVATVSPERVIDLVEARHPLIDPDRVVANSFHLNPEKRLVIITGPNAGGKTVAMKTVGLLVYMHQCGLALPTAKPGNLGYFDHVYADIGDSQSLLDNLSTFAGHVSNLAYMVRVVHSRDLVLIDELGTGTDPQEGEALAVAILKHLNAAKAFVVVSSHFALLKQLGYSEPGMRNASMRFDESKLTPTYELVLDMPGRSYGLEMAHRYGLDEGILAAAHAMVKANRQETSRLIDELQRQLEEQRAKTETLLAQEAEIERQKDQLAHDKVKIEKSYKDLESDIKTSKERVLLAAKEQAQAAINLLSNPNLKLHEAIAIKRELETEEEAEDVMETLEGELAIGDYALYAPLGISGRITALTKKMTTLLTDDGKSIRLTTASLQKIAAPEAPKKKVAFINKNEIRVAQELNLIGQRVDEALISLDAYIDSALAANMKRVRIIHGLGTGALRRAVTNYLEGKSYVASFRLGEPGEGGTGATVVFLK